MSASVRGDVVVLACAISAGIHGALAPGHAGDGPAAVAGFVAAAAVLAVLAAALSRRPESDGLRRLAVLSLGGLLASYALVTTSGLPLLHPEPEPVDALALATKAIEAAGLAAALGLGRGRPAAPAHTRTKGSPA